MTPELTLYPFFDRVTRGLMLLNTSCAGNVLGGIASPRRGVQIAISPVDNLKSGSRFDAHHGGWSRGDADCAAARRR